MSAPLQIVKVDALAPQPIDDPITMEESTSYHGGIIDPALPDQAASFLNGKTEQVGHTGDVKHGRKEARISAEIATGGHSSGSAWAGDRFENSAIIRAWSPW